MEIVELLDHTRVVRVGEHVRGLGHQCDRARDPVRLILRLFEHALDLASDTLGDRAVHRRSAGQPALDRDGVAPVFEVIEARHGLLEVGEHERRRRRAIAGDPGEVPVELRFETGRVPAIEPAALDPVPQRCEEAVEIGRARVGRGRRLVVGHGVECSGIRP